MKTSVLLTFVAIGLIIFGGYVGYSVRDSRAKAFAAKAAEDRRVAQAEFDVAYKLLQDSIARIKPVIIRVVAAAHAADSALANLPLPTTNDSCAAALDKQTARVNAAIRAADNWHTAFDTLGRQLAFTQRQRDSALARIVVLQSLRDEGAAVVASPHRKLFGFLPRPDLYLAGDARIQGAFDPEAHAGVSLQIRGVNAYIEEHVGKGLQEQRAGVRIVF